MNKLHACILIGVLACAPLTVSAQVVFSEIAWMGTVGSQFSEWIELENKGTTPVDLAGAGIYKAGGGTLVFLLSKTINAGGYLLVERVTASAPDAVPGVNDESGSFLASGLSNSGEYLVLKDRNGSTLDMIDASAGWPAGDNATKQTMQLSGNVWVTATSTPKAPFVPVVTSQQAPTATSTSSFSSEVAEISSHSSTALAGTATIAPDFSASIGRERVAMVGAPLEFEARTTGSYSGVLSYTWSFGDGSQSTQKNPKHAYTYPGDYVVVLRVGTPEEYAIARTLVRVVPVELSLVVHDSGRVDLSNHSPYEVNVGDWRIDGGKSSFVFPKETIILGKKKISLARSLTNMTVYASSTPILVSPDAIVSLSGIMSSESLDLDATPVRISTNSEILELRARIESLLAVLESTRSALAELLRK